MTTPMCFRPLTLSLFASAAAFLPGVMPPQTQGLSPAERTSLQACADPSLGSLRAGRVDAPAPFGPQERAELSSAQERSTSLAALRGGAPSNSEWGWIAVGAVAVIVLIVLL